MVHDAWRIQELISRGHRLYFFNIKLLGALSYIFKDFNKEIT